MAHGQAAAEVDPSTLPLRRTARVVEPASGALNALRIGPGHGISGQRVDQGSPDILGQDRLTRQPADFQSIVDSDAGNTGLEHRIVQGSSGPLARTGHRWNAPLVQIRYDGA